MSIDSRTMCETFSAAETEAGSSGADSDAGNVDADSDKGAAVFSSRFKKASKVIRKHPGHIHRRNPRPAFNSGLPGNTAPAWLTGY
ncbi:MAG TPA: hypothetical protein VNQ34_12025 [Xanthobacteraceae bacterium]|nr:hypothetical protein [Xanthobacteraceae bacterium]